MARGRFRKSGYHDDRSSACCACWKDPIYLVVSGIITCVIAGALCITFGALYQPSRKLVDNRLARRMSVVPHAPVLDEWTTDRDANVSYYFFNVTNPSEVMNNGSIPHLEQVGPFIFTKRQVRYNTYWTEDQSEVLYDQNVSFIPNPHPGSLDPDEFNITTLNIPLLTLVNVYKDPNLVNDTQSKLLRSILKAVFLFQDPLTAITSEEDLFIYKTPSELLWGYEDPVFKQIKDVAVSASVSSTFALQRNASQKENLVLTGKNGTSQKGEYVNFNGLPEIDAWGSRTARMINGTDGTIFGAGLNTTTNLTVFSDEVQRSFVFTYSNDTSLHGIDCYRFVMAADVFSNKTDPGFYANGPSGVLNASAVEQYHAPFFVSKPHFLDADPGYLKNVSGLNPIREEHDYFVDVEPITGTTFQDNKTSQYNVLLLQYPDVDQFQNLRNLTMFPVFYSSETSMISEESSKTFKRIIFESLVGTKIAISCLISISGLVCILSALCTALFAPKAMQRCHRLHRRASMQYPTHQNGMGEKTSLLNSDRSINT